MAIPHNPVQLAIVGGGIGSLTLLLGLLEHISREYIQPYLYEQAPAFGEIGAGVVFRSNLIRVIELLKLDITTVYYKYTIYYSDKTI